MSKLGMGELKRYTGLLSGPHLYEAMPGADAQRVDVQYSDGIAWVTFLDVEPEDAEVGPFDAREMAGKFTKTR